MELKHSSTSANYARIEQLGLDMAKEARSQRISAMTDFPALSANWRQLELEARNAGYDIFRAWRRLDIKARQVRLVLHWLTANQLDDILGDPYVTVAHRDTQELLEKNAAYGESWKRRGGVGAFMMLARKWDRLDNILAPTNGGSHMALLKKNPGDVLDDIGDLRRYLLLVEDEVLRLEDLPYYGHDKDDWHEGMQVTVYDRYRFAKPLQGYIEAFSGENDGVHVHLLESNNPDYPIGSLVWVHRQQCVRTTVADRAG